MVESKFNIKFIHNCTKYVYNTWSNVLLSCDKDICEYTDLESIVLLEKEKFICKSHQDEMNNLMMGVKQGIIDEKNQLDLTIILTNNCNFNCIYCYQEHIVSSLSLQKANILINKIENLIKHGVNTIKIHYFGGEPLLNISVLLFIHNKLKEFSGKYNVKYISFMTSNGSLLSQKVLRQLDIDLIQLTFDGDANSHGLYKISDNFTYMDLLEKIFTIMELTNITIRIRFNICKENANSFIKVIGDILDNNNIDKNRIGFIFNPMRNFNGNNKFTELNIWDYSKYDLLLRKEIQKHGIKLQLPRALKSPCKFSVGSAICVGTNLEPMYCTVKDNIDNFLNTKTTKLNIDLQCHDCKVLPLCLCYCGLLKDNNAKCISEKYIIVDLLKMYIDNSENWLV